MGLGDACGTKRRRGEKSRTKEMSEKEKQERVRKGLFFYFIFWGVGRRNVALFMSLIDVFVLLFLALWSSPGSGLDRCTQCTRTHTHRIGDIHS